MVNNFPLNERVNYLPATLEHCRETICGQGNIFIMKKHNISIKEMEQHDLRRAAHHEAGHLVAARHFGLDGFIFLSRIGTPTIETNAWTGRTYYTEGITRHQGAVLGWTGLCAEELADDDDFDPAVFEGLFELSIIDEDSGSCVLSGSISESDKDCILREGGNCEVLWANFQEAARIVSAERNKIASLANALLNPSAVMPRSRGNVRAFWGPVWINKMKAPNYSSDYQDNILACPHQAPAEVHVLHGDRDVDRELHRVGGAGRAAWSNARVVYSAELAKALPVKARGKSAPSRMPVVRRAPSPTGWIVAVKFLCGPIQHEEKALRRETQVIW